MSATAKLKRARNTNKYIRDLIKFFEDTRFYIPSSCIVEKYIKRLASLDGKEKYVIDNETLSVQKRLLGEQIYLYLATLSKTPKAIKGDSINLVDEFNEWFGKSIGLSNNFLDKEILLELVDDFYKWLENEEGVFSVDWGEIQNIEKTGVVLTRFRNEKYYENSSSQAEKIPLTYS